ncbi:MAG TPA: cupredoxin domain-containing protein [Candidatus Limnocylindrales bacterium]|nr:cupredoxin domain-containing protein [Candidatus Limnocylindrales bacterium]
MRFARSLTLISLALALVAGCGTANAGWTYMPAPSPTPPAASGAASGQPSAAASADPNLVTIRASGLKFDAATLTAPAGKPFQILFDNQDQGVPHNVAIHQGDASGPEVFKGEVFNGPGSRTYEVPALKVGQYGFACSVHPTMTGTLTAQ